VVTADSIYLFTKRWLDQHTAVYALPKTPGTHTAHLRFTHNVQGLVTGATMLEDKNLIALCGYGTSLQPFVFLLYDFSGANFFSANKRKIGIGLPFYKVEAVHTSDGSVFYLTNEKAEVVETPQSLHRLDLSPFLGPYLDAPALPKSQTLRVFPNPADEILRAEADGLMERKPYVILDALGRTVMSGALVSSSMTMDVKGLPNGVYRLSVEGFAPTTVAVVRP
ncbi:MAG TPA: T9SS type A sorting domain-containing protein, partial [Chitinophagales bacterium]|nr:T9SS type A sorting domain-containing protein [Chitinophagales bacterium]